jgi:hypothetical protein
MSYETRVTDVLDDGWSAWLDGLQVTGDAHETTIAGPVADQAALHGLSPRSATEARIRRQLRAKRQHRRRPASLADRRTPSGRVLPY